LAAVQVLTKFAQSYTDVVTAIELLNEPGSWALDMDQVKQFYYNGWQDVRNDNEDTIVVIHDAFLDIDSYWNGFMNAATGVNNVMLDTHIYQVFSPGEVARSPCEHVQVACAEKGKIAGTDKWLVVGEWTGAQTDCAKWLNGLGTGARYDGTFPGSSYVGDCAGKYTGTVAGMSQVDKTNLQYYVEAQLDAYEAHTGWIFWNWKTESAPEWNFQDLFNNGLIPNPLTSRNVPSQCDTTACLVPAG
jgi:glucan 1,3-beta-glucosidase